MKKLVAFSMTVLWTATASPSFAQYYDGYIPSDKPSVEIDLGALDGTPAASPPPSSAPVRLVFPQEQQPSAPPLALSPAPEAVTQYMLPPPEARAPARLLKPSPALAVIPPEQPPVVVLQQPERHVVAPTSRIVKPVVSTPPAVSTMAESLPEVTPVSVPVATPRAVPSLSDLTLLFEGDSSDITSTASEKLDALVAQMLENESLRLQLRAFATGEDGNKSSARRLSLGRALSVRSYLMDNGIRPTRVDVRALGSDSDQMPLDRVEMVFIR